ncbi:MAG: flagellar hook-associated protein FlgK [Novosphingobium sp.]|uniref:flagellar hook-associated protein FlgK n=1 Tax=Novosphingobium sp. TaxID=1874826 RepID=UPI0032B96F33
MASDMLQIAASGVRAARAALNVTSQNISNASTDGYIRRTIRLSEVALGGGFGRIGEFSMSGVRIDGLTRNADAFRQSEVRRTGSDATRAGIELAAYENIEAALEQSQAFPSLTAFENALQQLATDPVDPSLRTAVLEQGRTLSRTFGIASNGLDTVGEGLRFDAAAGVGQVNLLAGQLGQINVQLVRAQPGSADQAALMDRRDGVLKSLSGFADIDTDFAADQTVTVRIGGSTGPQLVSGVAADTLAMTTAGDGTVSFALAAGGAVTLAAGSLAGAAQGLVMVRDSKAGLDAVANNLIATANAAQGSGVALDGTPGQPLFSGSGAAGIALALASGAGIATAPAGAPAGSRDPANLSVFRNAMAGADISGQLSGLLFTVSNAAQGRRTTSDALDTIAAAAKLAFDSQAGVNLDEEAVNLVRFQQAFQASSKAIQIASDLFDTLLAIR